MPKKFDKNKSTTFHLVYRSQDDPLLHDEKEPEQVLIAVGQQNQSLPSGASSAVSSAQSVANSRFSSALSALSGTSRASQKPLTLSEFGDRYQTRANEGEAATHGIFYDDTQYDYMQHLRDIDTENTGGSVFLEAPSAEKERRRQQKKTSLADAIGSMTVREEDPSTQDDDLRSVSLHDSISQVSYASSAVNHRAKHFSSQQDVPDEIAGFQPDMDPRLREVLEALEDDAYVENENESEDLFLEIAQDRRELGLDEFEEQNDFWGDEGDDDGGWASDHTAKPATNDSDEEEEDESEDRVPELPSQKQVSFEKAAESVEMADPLNVPDAAEESGDWMSAYRKFKQDEKKKKPMGQNEPAGSEVQGSIWSSATGMRSGRKRKGAQTNPSLFSMSSSCLVRTEQLDLLDRRFEKTEADYRKLDDVLGGGGGDMASMSGVSAATSTVQTELRDDFDGIMDQFLGDFDRGMGRRKDAEALNPTIDLYQGGGGGKKGRRNNGKSAARGLAEYDALRKELGRPRIDTSRYR